MSEDICYADATELARRIRAKEVSPVEVLDAHLDRIEAINPKLNAIVTMANDASARAREAEAAVARGDTLGPLHGVPFTIKDCVDTAGVLTTRGSKLFQDYVPDTDAPVVARLKAAGGVLMAKTNMPEFAFWGETDNEVFGRTLNPWDPEHTTGGSSGGEGAAIAAGLSPLGIGSDVGGSVRLPAAFCGIVGLKATHGRIPLTGHWPETLLRFMHVGPMARTVRDVALELSTIAGPDGADSYALPVPLQDYLELGADLSDLRIGWNSGGAFIGVEPEVRDVVTRAATVLAEAGCRMEEVSLAGLAGLDTQALSMAVYNVEAGCTWSRSSRAGGDELSPNIQRRLSAPEPSLPEYMEARRALDGLREDMAAYFQEYDLLLCPATPMAAHGHGVTELVIAGETVTPRNVGRSTIPWNITGSPAISVPFAMSSGGLPIGVQIVGRHYDEATVLRAATAFEQVRGPVASRPPV